MDCSVYGCPNEAEDNIVYRPEYDEKTMLEIVVCSECRERLGDAAKKYYAGETNADTANVYKTSMA